MQIVHVQFLPTASSAATHEKGVLKKHRIFFTARRKGDRCSCATRQDLRNARAIKFNPRLTQPTLTKFGHDSALCTSYPLLLWKGSYLLCGGQIVTIFERNNCAICGKMVVRLQVKREIVEISVCGGVPVRCPPETWSDHCVHQLSTSHLLIIWPHADFTISCVCLRKIKSLDNISLGWPMCVRFAAAKSSCVLENPIWTKAKHFSLCWNFNHGRADRVTQQNIFVVSFGGYQHCFFLLEIRLWAAEHDERFPPYNYKRWSPEEGDGKPRKHEICKLNIFLWGCFCATKLFDSIF